jgi:pimeloyl-ACP methyl ester carboxylesterase
MNDAGPVPVEGSGPAFFRRRGFIVTIAIVIGFALIALWLVRELQGRVAFPRASHFALKPQVRAGVGGEQIWLDADGDRVEAWMLPARVSGRAPLMIHAHGNGEAIDTWAESVAPLRDAGIAVLLVEYPGYGRSAGEPTDDSIVATFLAAYDHAARDPRVDATRIVGYGRSMGGGVIAQLAARRPLAALVLESTFTSLRDMIGAHGVPDWLIRYRLDTRAVIAKFSRPILVIHGTQDGAIPVSNAHALLAAAPHARLQLLPCGHNDCPPQWELVRSFLAEIGVCKAPDPEVSHEIDAHRTC